MLTILHSSFPSTDTLKQRAHRQSQPPRGLEALYVANLLQKRPVALRRCDG